MDVADLLKYADWSKDRLRATVEEYAEYWGREFETTAGFKTIRELTAHIAGAEERWMMRIAGKPRPDPTYEERAGATIADVFGGWDVIRQVTRDFLAGAGPLELSVTQRIVYAQIGFDSDKSVAQMLFQLFNHQSYHLGQISMTLQRFGVDPPNFDAILVPTTD